MIAGCHRGPQLVIYRVSWDVKQTHSECMVVVIFQVSKPIIILHIPVRSVSR